MAQWSSTDNTSSSPLWGGALVNLSPNSANRDLLYQNSTPDSFVTGETIGVFGVAANEISAYSGAMTHTGWVLKRVGSGGRAGRVQTEVLVAGGFGTDTVDDILLSITSQPSNSTVNTHVATTFSVGAVGSPNTTISYVWQANTGSGFANLSDAGVYSNSTTNVLSISNTATLNAVSYRVLVLETGATTQTSANAKLTVTWASVNVTSQPADNSVANNAAATFSVNAVSVPTGPTLLYHWQKWGGASFADITANATWTNVTTKSFVITNAIHSTDDGLIFRVRINGVDVPNTFSTNATLTVAA